MKSECHEIGTPCTVCGYVPFAKFDAGLRAPRRVGRPNVNPRKVQ